MSKKSCPIIVYQLYKNGKVPEIYQHASKYRLIPILFMYVEAKSFKYMNTKYMIIVIVIYCHCSVSMAKKCWPISIVYTAYIFMDKTLWTWGTFICRKDVIIYSRKLWNVHNITRYQLFLYIQLSCTFCTLLCMCTLILTIKILITKNVQIF